jgi:membrane-associated phospholipid phosphatase
MLNNKVSNNLSRTTLGSFLPPVLLLIVIFSFLFKEGAFTVDAYVNIQKDLFLYLNSKLSLLPSLQFNLTQLGDVLISLPLLTVFIIYAPKLWGAILSSTVIAGILSFPLKELFAIPRPAAMFDNDSFVIVGETLTGHTSFPSGHSIATFTVISILLFAFMPKEFKFKIVWSVFILILGLIIAFSRVGVGAHYPLDVVFGGAIGYISGLVGILINNKVSWWDWIKHKKYYPIIMLVLAIWIIAIINELFTHNLVVFYISLVAIITTLFLMIKSYAKK